MKQRGVDIDEILERYPSDPQHLIALLQDVQAEYGYISPESLHLVCDHIGVPPTRAWSVATFYKSFRLEPRGDHEVKVCLGTACHLKGSWATGSRTSGARLWAFDAGEDHRRPLKFTRGYGSIAWAPALLSPVVVVDEEYHAQMPPRVQNVQGSQKAGSRLRSDRDMKQGSTGGKNGFSSGSIRLEDLTCVP